MKMKLISCLLLTLTLTRTAEAAFPGANKAARELAEWIAKKGGKSATRELAEYGGEKALRETLEKVAHESGEDVAERMFKLTKEHGILTFKSLANDPEVLTDALERVPRHLSNQAARALERNTDELVELVAKYGADALELAARQPGVGPTMLARFGEGIIPVGRELTEKQFMDFTRYADYFARMPDSVRAQNLDFFSKNPQKVLDFLEAHPNILKTTSAVGLVFMLKDDVGDVILGEPEMGPDGIPRPRGGLIDKTTEAVEKGIDKIAENWPLILAVVFILAFVPTIPKYLSLFRKNKE